MIVSANRIYGSRLDTGDRKCAAVHDLLFDDRTWHVRYLVVRFRQFLGNCDVLLTPEQIDRAGWAAGNLQTSLSLSEVLAAPSLLSDPPVAQQGQMEAARMIVWEAYWTGLFERLSSFGDPNLRNTRGLTGHRLFGLDSAVGRIDNLVIDDQGWIIRYLVARLDPPLGGRSVMIDPHLVDSMSWQNRSVHIRLPRESIEKCDVFAGAC